jgi:hypothetical protein
MVAAIKMDFLGRSYQTIKIKCQTFVPLNSSDLRRQGHLGYFAPGKRGWENSVV